MKCPIIQANWSLLGPILGYGKKNVGKEKGTEWIQEINEHRKIAMHSSSGAHISIEQLESIKHYHEWLEKQIENPDSGNSDETSVTTGTED